MKEQEESNGKMDKEYLQAFLRRNVNGKQSYKKNTVSHTFAKMQWNITFQFSHWIKIDKIKYL